MSYLTIFLQKKNAPKLLLIKYNALNLFSSLDVVEENLEQIQKCCSQGMIKEFIYQWIIFTKDAQILKEEDLMLNTF